LNRNYAIDVVKCLGVMAVVLIHATAPLGYHDIGTIWTYDWYRPALEFAVPFFFAASGYLLYQKTKDSDDNEYVWLYARRILVYYLGATLFYIVFAFALALSNRLFLESSFRKAAAKIIGAWNYTALLNGSLGWYHLYFLAALFGGCVILLVLRSLKLDARSVFLAGASGYLLTLVGYITIDGYYAHGGLLKGFFFLTIGYYVSSLQPENVWRPGTGLALSMAAFYVSWSQVQSMVIIPLAAVTFYTMVLVAKYPDFGRGSVLASWGTRSLEIYIFHDAARIVIERAFIYAGVVKYYESPWYYIVAIPFSFFAPLAIANFMTPLRTALGAQDGPAPALVAGGTDAT